MTKIKVNIKRNPSLFSQLSNTQKLSLIKEDLLEAKENYHLCLSQPGHNADMGRLKELYEEAQDVWRIALKKWGPE